MLSMQGKNAVIFGVTNKRAAQVENLRPRSRMRIRIHLQVVDDLSSCCMVPCDLHCELLRFMRQHHAAQPHLFARDMDTHS